MLKGRCSYKSINSHSMQGDCRAGEAKCRNLKKAIRFNRRVSLSAPTFPDPSSICIHTKEGRARPVNCDWPQGEIENLPSTDLTHSYNLFFLNYRSDETEIYWLSTSSQSVLVQYHDAPLQISGGRPGQDSSTESIFLNIRRTEKSYVPMLPSRPQSAAWYWVRVTYFKSFMCSGRRISCRELRVRSSKYYTHQRLVMKTLKFCVVFLSDFVHWTWSHTFDAPHERLNFNGLNCPVVFFIDQPSYW